MPHAVALNPETVKAFLASISYVLTATKVWLELRDRAKAKNEATVAESLALSDPNTAERAKALLAIVPEDTVELMMERFRKCYEKLNEMLANPDDYFDNDFDKAAHSSLPKCCCRALSIFNAVAGLADPQMIEAWKFYKCDEVLKQPE